MKSLFRVPAYWVVAFKSTPSPSLLTLGKLQMGDRSVPYEERASAERLFAYLWVTAPETPCP
ncbi:MAG TPA: hypothetical protein VG122_15565 [Gemmata sp.]|jgi:hypothetical protein|nr:hypothetical protein [Gemmata sp.]